MGTDKDSEGWLLNDARRVILYPPDGFLLKIPPNEDHRGIALQFYALKSEGTQVIGQFLLTHQMALELVIRLGALLDLHAQATDPDWTA